MLKVLDLFSGIGGFSLGLERTGGFETKAFCDIDPFCRRVLAKHWPKVPCYDDVRTLSIERHSVDVVCGGPPCQKTSVAAAIQGKRSGETLLPELVRLVNEGRPEWALIEQPPGNRAWEDQVAYSLAGIGYHVARHERSAESCGAPHVRRRVFFIANAVRERCETVARLAGSSPPRSIAWPSPPRGAWRTSGAGNSRVDDGLSSWVDRLRTIGNTVLPQAPELIGNAILASLKQAEAA